MVATANDNNNVDDDIDALSSRIRREAQEAMKAEPELTCLFQNTVLGSVVETFEDAVAAAISFRLLSSSASSLNNNNNSNNDCTLMAMDFETLRNVFQGAFHSENEYDEGGNSIAHAVRRDVLSVIERDPACPTVLEVVLFFKGFAALVTHRVARYRWHRQPKSMVALFLQSQASSMFGVDIHPAATIGCGVMLDHGTGIVIGETAVVGDGCTLLHGVTLGGTGKEAGDRHPKLGQNVLIGAGASILGNIAVGNACKIGAGSIVLRPIPAGATAVGAPAKIIGRVLEENPAHTMDKTLKRVSLLHKSQSMMDDQQSMTTSTTEDLTITSEEDNNSSSEDHLDFSSTVNDSFCPFREYRRLGLRSPPGYITICTLQKFLLPLGCTPHEIGCLFFAMDTRDVGHIDRKYFESHGKDMILQYTCIPKETLDQVWGPFLESIPVPLNKCGKSRGTLHLSAVKRN